jgi:hypothetical protein
MRISDLYENRVAKPPDEKSLQRLRDAVNTLEQLHDMVPVENVEARYYYRIDDDIPELPDHFQMRTPNLHFHVRANGNRTYAKIYAIGHEFTVNCTGKDVLGFVNKIITEINVLKRSIRLIADTLSKIARPENILIGRKNSAMGATHNTDGITVYRYKPMISIKMIPAVSQNTLAAIDVYISGSNMGYCYVHVIRENDKERLDHLVTVIDGLISGSIGQRNLGRIGDILQIKPNI